MTALKLPTMNTHNEGGRVHLTVYLDGPRYERLWRTTDAYAQKIGRQASLSLMITRALDLLHDHLDSLDNPMNTFTERLSILGPARHPLPETDKGP